MVWKTEIAGEDTLKEGGISYERGWRRNRMWNVLSRSEIFSLEMWHQDRP